MNIATAVPAQQAPDSPLIDAALCDSLARELNVSAQQVEAIYREEICRLAAGARIRTFLGVLATRRVRVRLGR